MKETQVECINCGMRCKVDVTHDEDTVYEWDGNNCMRGEDYAIKTLDLPYRMLETYLRVDGGKVAAVKARTLDRVAVSELDSFMRMLAVSPIPAPLMKRDVVEVAGVRFEIMENVAKK